MKNILICQLNSKYIHSSLAAWYLLSGLKEYSKSEISACVFEGTINEKISDILGRIVERTPDIIGFSCYIWNIGVVKKLAREIKRLKPETVVIFGGPEVAFSYERVLRERICDYVVCGEGEHSLPELCDAIISHNGFEKLHGVAYLNGDTLLYSAPKAYNDIPNPYTNEYFASLNKRIAYLETSRGCPFSCAFCLSGHESKVVFFSEERAKNDILKLAASGTSTIKLVDRTFNADRKRACRIWSFIGENYGKSIPEGVRFHFEISPALLDDEAYEVISKLPYGSVQFEVGLQSFNIDTLKAIGRDTDIARAFERTKRLIALGNVHVHTDLIAGLPLEDYNSFAESFNKAFELGANMLQLGFLKVLSGSPMGAKEYPYKCKFSETAPYEVISTDCLSSDELIKLHKIEDLHERLYNSARFRRTLDYALSQTGLSPFALLEKLSETIIYDSRASLDTFTHALYKAMTDIGVSDVRALSDIMIIDRITTNNEGRIPEFLKCERELTSELKKALKHSCPELFAPGVKSSIAYLKSQKRGVYVRYDKPKDAITGEYAPIFTDIFVHASKTD